MYVQGLFLLGLVQLLTQNSHGSCVGPIEYPAIDNFRFKQTAVEEGVQILVETEMTTLDPVTLTWIIREYYDSWPNTALYYFVPDEGDANFEVTALKENNSTKFRIKGGPLQDPKTKVYVRISIEHPCTTVVLTMNIHTLQLVYDRTINLPVFLEVPKPQYIVGPGEELTLTLKIENQLKDAITAHYGFSRHLHRVGDSLVLQQRFNNITRYNFGAPNLNYTKYGVNPGSFSNVTVFIKFRPWLRTDAGVFSVSTQTNYWLPGGPYRYHTMVLLQSFVDLRSRRMLPPAFVVYNELAWIFNRTRTFDQDGTYIIPLPKQALWRPSLICFAHSQRAPRLRVYKKNGTKRIPLGKSSQVFGLKTVTGEAFNVKPGSKNNYTCNTIGHNQASVDFRIRWYDAVKIVRRSPQERAITIRRKSRRSINVRCVGTGSPRPFAKFYLFDSIFGFIPKRKDFTTIYKANEIENSASFRVSSKYNRRRKQITGKLTVTDLDLVRDFKVLVCLIGNEYSFDFYRYFIVEY